MPVQAASVDDWTQDGKSLMYTMVSGKTATDLWVLPLEEGKPPFAYLEDPFDQRNAQFSPDGHWVAYQSNEPVGGGSFEVYVRPFLAAGGVWQISRGGGTRPTWRADGKELFYQNGRTIMAVDMHVSGGVPEPGVPHPLFSVTIEGDGNGHRSYTVSPDGQRFFISTRPTTEPTVFAQTPVTVVVNWTGLLKK